jgi:hypothetical protein
MADCIYDVRKDLKRANRAVDLPTGMISDHNAVASNLHRF